MKCWFLRAEAGRMVVDLRDAPVPTAGPGQVVVRVRAAALNRGEFIAGHGLHTAGGAKPAGFEGAGEVVEVGEGVTAFHVGDRVMGRCEPAFAEFGCMVADEVFPVPDGMSWEHAASATVACGTVHDALIGQGQLRAGEWVLVTGIASGVGVAALQVAKALGARVIGTSGSADKLARLQAMGLDIALHTRAPDFVPAVLEATGGRGVDIAANTVGGSLFPALVESLAFEGRLATIGYVDGQVHAGIDLAALHKKRLRLYGVSNKMRTVAHRVEAARAFARDVLPLLADGGVVPVVDEVFAFDALPRAQQRMEENAHLGKLVVRMD